MLSKEIYGFISVGLAFISSAAYFVSVLQKKTKPHIFSWVLWGLLTGITFFAQYSAHAGAGSWNMAMNAVLCFVVAGLTYTRGDHHIERRDIVVFGCALMAIPVWYYTNDPLFAVLIAIVIEGVAYFLTIKKSYIKPHEENAFTFTTDTVRFIISLFAMESYSLTTALYPAFCIAANVGLVSMLLYRRRQLLHQPTSTITGT